MKRPLVIIGEGSDRERLESMASEHITFLGKVSDEILQDHYARCRALIFPGEEDFGLTPVEVQASGRPVIAYARGGVLETVQEGVTGCLFFPQTPDALADAVLTFDVTSVDPQAIRLHALQFDVSHFKEKIQAYLKECLSRNRVCSVNG